MSAPRTLLPYQARWVRDAAGLAVIEKSRRIGISWASAYQAVMHAGEGVGDVYYQGYALEMARGFIGDASEWAKTLQIAAEQVGETLLNDGRKAIQAYRLSMASGRQILAMTSSPRAFRSRGRPGDLAIIDEAAFVDDLQAVLKAALAFRTWGGRVRVISTHNGEASLFNSLCRNVRDGEQPGSLHSVCLSDAIADGFYKRICDVANTPWSPRVEREWEAGLRADYGANASEELDCIPSSGGGAWIAWHLIRTAEHPQAGNRAEYQNGRCFIGIDIARRRDLWVAVVLEKIADVLWVRELITRRGITFAEQRAIVRNLALHYQPVRIIVDQTGMGEAVVEQLQDDHGKLRVEGVLLTSPRRLDVATALREAFEDARIRIPTDEAVRADLHSVHAEAGPTGAPRLIAQRSNTDGHADRFWALALACAAASSTAQPAAGITIDEQNDPRDPYRPRAMPNRTNFYLH